VQHSDIPLSAHGETNAPVLTAAADAILALQCHAEPSSIGLPLALTREIYRAASPRPTMNWSSLTGIPPRSSWIEGPSACWWLGRQLRW